MAARVERIDESRWRVPVQGGMRTEGLVFASDALMETMRADAAIEQVANVAHLPGIVGPSIAMPDIHWGYGFPIGGVAAFDPREGGVVSPGGVGFDINCGVRMLRSDLVLDDVRPRLAELGAALFEEVPSGVGSIRKGDRLGGDDLDEILIDGAAAAVARGWGTEDDLEHLESGGCLPDADPRAVTERARERGLPQLGTLGSGNHFLEVGWISEVYDAVVAEAFGLGPGQLTVFVHTGSRGLGHQVCDDHTRSFQKVARTMRIDLPDRQLACAPLSSPEASHYLAAMNAAANFAFANRQRITHAIRSAFARVLGGAAGRGLEVVYDVCHNVAKWEEHRVAGRSRRLLVHRKGATRAFPAKHPLVPAAYRAVGQPVLVPGDMGRYSYVLVGAAGAMEESFGSSCHGAGRVMSRSAAKRIARAGAVKHALASRGILVLAASNDTLVEEIPEAYKDVAEVVAVVERAGLSRIVAQHRPALVVKG
jgi:tRNA-splicing ligase RtcB